MAQPQLLRNLEQFELISEVGADWETCAHYFGMSVEQLDALVVKDPSIKERYLQAKARGKVFVMLKLREKIDKGSFMGMKLYLETQAGWIPTTKTELSGPGGGPIPLQDLSWAKERLSDLLSRKAG